MKIYEPYPGIYNFKHLPGLALYILQNHLTDFAVHQLQLIKQINLPLLKHIKHLGDEQIIEHIINSTRSNLEYISTGRAREQLKVSITRWLHGPLTLIHREDLGAEDIAGLNYVRSKLFKKFARLYYPTLPEQLFELFEEIDTFIFTASTSTTNTFIDLLKDKINEELKFNNLLINTSPGLIFIFDFLTKRIIYANGNAEQITGYTFEELTSSQESIIDSSIHPEDANAVNQVIEEIIHDRQGKVYEVEYRFKHKDGQYRWLQTYALLFKKDDNGNPIQILGNSFEITNERETATILKKKEEQLLEAQAIAKLGSFEWDLQNDLANCTPELFKILELERNETHEGFMKRVHPYDQEKVRKDIEQSLITGIFDSQYRYLSKGKEKTLWTRGIIIFEHGKPAFMRGTIQDITELKKIEDELLKKTQELERSNESLQQFASIASHDLKEPLRKMSMYSDMVLMSDEDTLSENSMVNLKKVKASAIRMQHMIEDILNFSSITKEEVKEKINLSAIIDEVKEILAETIEEKKAIIVYHDLPEVFAIPSHFKQLFQNLISNSLKFSKSDINPRIEISHRCIHKNTITEKEIDVTRQYHEILVSDNGIGFKQEYSQKIFGLFTRLHGRAAFEGSGLGLSICKKIVENYGGIIKAESCVGEGSTFTIILPIDNSDKPI